MTKLLNKCYFWIFMIPLLLCIFWFRDGSLMATAESGFPFYNLNYMQQIASHSWTDTNLGNSMGIRVASFPTYFTLSIFEKLNMPNFIIQAGFFYVLFVSAGIGICKLTRILFEKIDNKYVLLAILFYWFNPISLVSVWNRFLNNYMVFWAMLPVVSYFYLRGLKEKKYRYAVITALSTVLFSYALTSPVFSILLWGVFMGITSFFLATSKARLFCIKYFLLTLAFFVLANFWWISSFFVFMFSSDFSVSVESFLPSNGNLNTLRLLSESSGKFIYTTRLLEQVFFTEGNPPWGKYFINPLIVLAQLLIVIFVIYKSIRFRKNHSVLLLALLFISTIFLMKGNLPPFGELFESLFSRSLVFQGFRNPFEKFGFLLPLSFSPLLAFAFSKTDRFQKIIYSLVIFYIAIILGYPFWSGQVFSYYKPRSRDLYSYKVEAPGEYKLVNQWLKENINEGERFVSLPISGEGITYNWKNKFSGVELSNTLYEIPNISYNTTIPFYSEFVKKLSSYQTNEQMFEFFPFMNVRFIVLRKDIDFMDRRLPDPDKIESKLLEYEKKGLIAKRYEAGPLYVYEVDKRFRRGLFYATPNVAYSNSLDFPDISNSFSESSDFAITNNTSRAQLDKYLIYPYETFSVERINLLDQTSEELVAKLSFVKHLPETPLYPFIRIKELLIAPPLIDNRIKAIYDINVLGKRAVEIYHLRSQDAEESILKKSQADYAKTLINLAMQLEGMPKTELRKDSLIMDKLFIHLQLFEQIGEEESYNFLVSVLNELEIIPKYSITETKSEIPKSTLVYRFSVPISGEYEVDFENRGELFVDGKKHDGNTLSLEAGEHEFSLLIDKNIHHKPVLTLEEFTMTHDNTKEFEFSFPSEGADYQINFDFLYSRGSEMYISIIQDNDYDYKPLTSSLIVKHLQYHDWQTWSKEFTTTVGANSARVKFYPARDINCQSILVFQFACSDMAGQFDVKVRNFRVTEVNTPDLKLVKVEQPENQTSDTEISWSKKSPTEYEVEVIKHSNEEELIVFSELFDTGWKSMKLNEESKTFGSHLIANGFANAWVINQPGEYKLRVYYESEKYLQIAKIISLVSVVGLALYLLKRK